MTTENIKYSDEFKTLLEGLINNQDLVYDVNKVKQILAKQIEDAYIAGHDDGYDTGYSEGYEAAIDDDVLKTKKDEDEVDFDDLDSAMFGDEDDDDDLGEENLWG